MFHTIIWASGKYCSNMNQIISLPHFRSTWGDGWWWGPCRQPPSSGSGFSRSASWRALEWTRSARWCSAASLRNTTRTFKETWKQLHATAKPLGWFIQFSLDFIVWHYWQSTAHIFNQLHLQSRCFFFGPIISSVVALHTAFASPWKRFANGKVSISQQIKGKVLTFGRCKYDSIHELDVHLACQTVPGCKNSVVDGLTRCRHPEPTKQLWNTEAVQKRFSTFWWKQRSLFSKEGGPPIIMGPPGLRTAVLPVAGCQYPAQPCPAHAHCRQLHQGACASQP